MRPAGAALLLVVLASGCGDDAAPGDSGAPAEVAAASCDTSAARSLATRLGERMRGVSLLAPDSTVRAEMREAYGDLAAPALLERWSSNPASAPGRAVSSPWPERIDVARVTRSGSGCEVEGEVVYVTSSATDAAHAAAASREHVRLRTESGRITDWDAEVPRAEPRERDAGSAQVAADVLRRYYAAIDAGAYPVAFRLWGDEGRRSGQTEAAFAAGFAHTAHVEVDVGEPGRVEGAAGSRYVEIPVVVQATTDAGATQRFEGSYTMRRVVVDGATDAQRDWHIESAKLRRTE